MTSFRFQIGNQYAKGNKPNKTSFKKGEHRSPETEFKKGEMSERMAGSKNHRWKGGISKNKKCFDCGLILQNYKAKRCKKCFDKFNCKGNHWNWQGGKSFVLYGEEFKQIRKEILIRDNFKCQICSIENNLVIHHIDFIKKNNKTDNLICLCRKCHRQIHNKNGKFIKKIVDCNLACINH
jgi:hypothetical protein